MTDGASKTPIVKKPGTQFVSGTFSSVELPFPDSRLESECNEIPLNSASSRFNICYNDVMNRAH